MAQVIRRMWDVRPFVPPSRVLTLAVVVLIPTIAVAGGLQIIGGTALALAFLLGATAGVPSATASTPALVRLGAGTLCVVAAVGGSLTSESSVGAAPPSWAYSRSPRLP